MASNFNLANDNKVTIGIHQPNYLPWLGYFYKMYVSEIFVFHDNVQYSKRYPTRRTRIRAGTPPKTTEWLTVPLLKHSDFSLIKELRIASDAYWQNKHLTKIKEAYRKAPYFVKYCPLLESWYQESRSAIFLADLNILLIKKLINLLGIECLVYRSSKLPVNGKGSSYNLALAKYFKASSYICGTSSKIYQNDENFATEHIKVLYSGFGDWLLKTPYQQKQGNQYLGGLSILDALFNLGSENTLELFKIYDQRAEATDV